MKISIPSLFAGALLVSCASTPQDGGPGGILRNGATTATGQASPPPRLEVPTLRLPDAIVPLRYDADLTLDPAETGFKGTLAIELTARRAERVVWLNAVDLTLRSASFQQRDGKVAGKEVVEIVTGHEPFVGLVLPAELTVGQNGVLRIEYEGKIDAARPQGVYSVAEGSGPDDKYVYSLFEPLDARRAFPCFDEPTFKVPWKLSIRVKKGHTAFSNAEAVSQTEEDGLTKISFAETPPIPSYLVAFMAGPFETVEAGTVGREKKKLRFLVPRGRGSETAYAAQVTPRIIDELEGYFGMAMPYSKLDVAVVPRYEGTMEHPGIVALGQPLTLIKPGEDSVARKQAYVDIAAHELAHYWFGDYVTMTWWDDTWLNESFAQWMDAKITNSVEPAWKFNRVRLERAASAMSADRLASAKRLRQPVLSNEDILNAFDGSLTYEKGSSVITMMEHAVSPSAWQSVIRRYMGKNAWKNATAADFSAVLGDVAGAEAAASFESFLNQPGVPKITVTPVCGSGSLKLRIEQQRFLPLGTTADAALWSVPVCVRFGAGDEKGHLCATSNEKSKEVPIIDLKECPEWLVPNDEGVGYYISSYSPESIGRLVGKKKTYATLEERAVMMRDVGFLVSNGSFPLGKAMALVPDAVATGEKTTLESVESILTNVHPVELSDPLHAKYQSFIRKTFTPRAKALGFAPKAGEDSETGEMRTELLFMAGLGGEEPELLATSKTLASQWLDDPKAVSKDVLDAVLALAVSSNDKALFEKLLGKAKATQDRSEKTRLLRALGHVTDKPLVQRILDVILGKDLEFRESLFMIYPLLRGRKTRDLAFAFVLANFDEIVQKSSAFERPYLFDFAGTYCDEAHRTQARAFFGPRAKNVEGAQRVLENALESIALCEASRKSSLPELEAFLKKL